MKLINIRIYRDKYINILAYIKITLLMDYYLEKETIKKEWKF